MERQIDGKRQAITLEVSGETEAEAELALFNRDPKGYLTARQAKEQAQGQAVDLRPELVQRYLDFLRANKRTEKYVRNVRGYLTWWDEALIELLGAGWDLRLAALPKLKEALATETTAYRKRAMALKGYASWLREEAALLHPSQDPTLALTAPAPLAERVRRTKGYSMEHVEAVYRQVGGQSVRDTIRVHCATGWHNTEIQRLCRDNGLVREVQGHGEIAAVCTVWHKTNREHLQSIPHPALAALKRLIARGRAPEEKWVTKELHAASERAKLPETNYGELRHSFTAWAETCGRMVRPAETGVPLNEISAALGHSSTRTTKTFYRVTAVPAMVAVPIKLYHPEDPVELAQVAKGSSAG